MKGDDRTMMLLTALVLVVGLGTVAQKGDMFMAVFRSVDAYTPVDDSFDLQAGNPANFDVLANDINVAEGDAERLLIVNQPSCGVLRRTGATFDFIESAACEGEITFSYCVVQGDNCPAADVTLTVAPPEALPEFGGGLADQQPSFPKLEAPALAVPDDKPSLAPIESMAAIRSRTDSPALIPTPESRTDSLDIAPQRSAAVTAGSDVPSGLGGGFAPDISTPQLGLTPSSQPRIASSRSPAPRLKTVGEPDSPRIPQSVTALQTSAPPRAPSAPVSSLPQTAALAAPSIGGANALDAPDISVSVSGAAGIGRPRVEVDRGPRVAGMLSRPVDGGLPASPTAIENTAAPRITVAQTSSRPSIQTPVERSDPVIVTERAAQILVPTTPPNAELRSGGAVKAPSVPVEQDTAALDLPPQTQRFASEPQTEEDGFDVAALPVARPQNEETALPALADSQPVSCGATVLLAEKFGKVLAVTVTSECRPASLVTIEHAGISFTERTDDAGKLQFDIPAIAEDATISARFEDGTSAEASAIVRGLDRASRVGISWSGPANLDLHAYEFGAADGSDGHVWEGQPRSYKESRRSGGGYISVFGIPGEMQAEVYTLPINNRTTEGVVDLIIRASSTEEFCGRNLEITAVQNDQRLSADRKTLDIELAGCDATQTELAYPALLRDISVARR